MTYYTLIKEIIRIEQAGDFKRPLRPIEKRLESLDDTIEVETQLLGKAESIDEIRGRLTNTGTAVLNSLARCGDFKKAREYADTKYKPLEDNYFPKAA